MIVVHAAIDIVLLVGDAAQIGPASFWHPPLLKESGIDSGFVATLIITVVSGVGAVLALWRLAVQVHGAAPEVGLKTQNSPA